MNDVRISKVPGISFKNLHPSPSVGRTLKVEGTDNKYVRCKQCGSIVNTDINARGSGYGNETASTITTIAGGTANAKNPGLSGGCPLCGSSEY